MNEIFEDHENMEDSILYRKHRARSQVQGDLRMYGIVSGIILALIVIMRLINGVGLSDFMFIIGVSLFCGYILSSIGVGLKFVYHLLHKKISSGFLCGLIIFILGQFITVLVGMILLPVRIVINTVRWIVLANREKAETPENK